MFKTKAKARTFEAETTTFCPRAVLEVEDSLDDSIPGLVGATSKERGKEGKGKMKRERESE